MSPETLDPPQPRGRRRISLWLLRLGIGGFFVAASAVALVSFTLFGCPCLPPLRVPEADKVGVPTDNSAKTEQPPEPPRFGTPK